MGGLSSWMQPILDFVRDHKEFAPAVVFAFAFLESLAFLSLIVPATVILTGLSVLFYSSGLSLVPLVIAGGLGASLGYAISYGLAIHFREGLLTMWPLKNHPDMVRRSEEVFRKWGAAGVFFGHFFGPIRAVIPVVAGIAQMPALPFQFANIASSFLWSLLIMGFPQSLVTAGDRLKVLFGPQ